MSRDDKFYKVFVSSTYDDLRPERNSVFDALLRSNCFPVGMEHFPSSAMRSLDLIAKYIDQCDYFVVVSAGVYGSIVQRDERGFVEWEYDYACTRMPCFSFLHKNPDELPGKFLEKTNRDKLDAFRKRLKDDQRPVDFYSNADELCTKVLHAFQRAQVDSPATGWVRADANSDRSWNPLNGAWRLVKSSVPSWDNSPIIKFFTDEEFLWLKLSNDKSMPMEYIAGFYQQNPYGGFQEFPQLAFPHTSVLNQWQMFEIDEITDERLLTVGSLSTGRQVREEFQRLDWGPV